jgi:protoporphyrinogen/coproporphyrinogen III oxidase
MTIVIGGGITGLTSYYYLQKRGIDATLIEQSSVSGGVLMTHRKDGFVLECGPNVLVMNPELSDLLNEMNLSTDIVFPAIEPFEQYIYSKNAVYALPKSPGAFLQTPLLTKSEKFWLIINLFRKNIFTSELDDDSILNFFSPLSDSRFVYNIIDPVLKGMYGGNVSMMSTRSIFPDLWEAGNHGTSLFQYIRNKRKRVQKDGLQKSASDYPEDKKKRMFTLKGGNDLLIKALSKNVPIINDKVKAIEREGSGFKVCCESGTEYTTRRVIITTSGVSCGSLIESLDSDLGKGLSLMKFSAIVVVHVKIPRSSDVLHNNGFGVLFPADTKDNLLGIMCNTVLFPDRAPESDHLLTLCFGGVFQKAILNKEYTNKDDEYFYKATAHALESYLGIKGHEVLNIIRWPYAIPQLEVGHFKLVERVKNFQKMHPGLHSIGSFLGDVGVSGRVKAAKNLIYSL